MMGDPLPLEWLLAEGEPWTRYRVLADLLDRQPGDRGLEDARLGVLGDPRVRRLVTEVMAWPGYALQRHNDAAHPIHKLAVLADFGVRAGDPGVRDAVETVLARHSAQGAFQTLQNIPQRFGGTGQDTWAWVLCDAPLLLSSLLALGLAGDPRVQAAIDHLVSSVEENGWRCRAAPELGRFRGPGKRGDPCPIANVYALRALVQVPDLADSPAVRAGCEMLLWHWAHQTGTKIYMFGIGTTYRRLKYPLVWYDLLHVIDVLSRFPAVHADPRFVEMWDTIVGQADEQGRYKAGSMYMAWKGWGFADKKVPSPWITTLVLRIARRLSTSSRIG